MRKQPAGLAADEGCRPAASWDRKNYDPRISSTPARDRAELALSARRKTFRDHITADVSDISRVFASDAVRLIRRSLAFY